jgi:hypothetical protein
MIIDSIQVPSTLHPLTESAFQLEAPSLDLVDRCLQEGVGFQGFGLSVLLIPSVQRVVAQGVLPIILVLGLGSQEGVVWVRVWFLATPSGMVQPSQKLLAHSCVGPQTKPDGETASVSTLTLCI